jgi:hypothetical protein
MLTHNVITLTSTIKKVQIIFHNKRNNLFHQVWGKIIRKSRVVEGVKLHSHTMHINQTTKQTEHISDVVVDYNHFQKAIL